MTESSSLPIVSSSPTIDPIDLIKDTAISGDVVRKTIADQAVSWNSRIITFVSAPYGYAVVGVIALLLICLCHKYLLKQATTTLINEKNRLVIENAQLQSDPLALRVQELASTVQGLEVDLAATKAQNTLLTETVAKKDVELSVYQGDLVRLEASYNRAINENSGLAAQVRQAQQLFTELERKRKALADLQGTSKAPSSV